MAEITKLSKIVARQLPEFVREDYPTFVAFVEAYYEYLTTNGVDISHMKDIDVTITEFVEQFRKELAYNLPLIVEDERFLLTKIKDLYLAKGSEGSFKLLFRLLFGKPVSLYYPGQQMLIPSDGKWNQEISVFVKVDFGNVDDVVGRLVEITSGDRILSVLVDRKEDLVGEVERVRQIGDGIYELYLDKRFFGVIRPGDKIRFQDKFQCTILPATTYLTVSQPGKNFRVGQVFELKSGTGTGALVKVTAITDVGGIKRAEIIKFGIGYTADFAISVLATNSVTSKAETLVSLSSRSTARTYTSAGPGAISFTNGSKIVTATNGGSFGGTGEATIGHELWTEPADPDTPEFVGVINSISEDELSVTLIDDVTLDSDSNVPYTFHNSNSIGDPWDYTVGLETYSGYWTSTSIQDRTAGFEEQGYINNVNVIVEDYVDGTYSGRVDREFALNSANAQTNSDDPAVISITLGALNRYPGYFESNHGFLSDSIFIQDSKYYQRFSYVLKIDERLQSYASAVKTMVHPTGMRLFGEFDVTNNFDLAIALESLVKSLGIGLEEDQLVRDLPDFDALSETYGRSSSDIESAWGKDSWLQFNHVSNTGFTTQGFNPPRINGLVVTNDYSNDVGFGKRIAAGDKWYNNFTGDNQDVIMQEQIEGFDNYKYLDSEKSIFDGINEHDVSWSDSPVTIDGSYVDYDNNTANDSVSPSSNDLLIDGDLSTPDMDVTKHFGKRLTSADVNYDGDFEGHSVSPTHAEMLFGQPLDTPTDVTKEVSIQLDALHNFWYGTSTLDANAAYPIDSGWTMSHPDNDGTDTDIGFEKSLLDEQSVTEEIANKTYKYMDSAQSIYNGVTVHTVDEYPDGVAYDGAYYLEDGSTLGDDEIDNITNRVDVYLNSYNGQDYWVYTEEYEGGLAQTTAN